MNLDEINLDDIDLEELIAARAREIRNEYQREYNKKNREKRRKSNNSYWARKAIQKLKEEGVPIE